MGAVAYRGRFAPSPSGPLHFGSLVAAVASYADARHSQGEWLVRIEDIDETRTQRGAERAILDSLQLFGMQWDAPPVRQSQRKPLYKAALHRLIERRSAFRCTCSRKTIGALARMGQEGPIYPGTCLANPPPDNVRAAWRLHVEQGTTGFTDKILGPIRQDLCHQVGDFVIRRIDGFFAYQLAVVVDDHEQQITDVVRGADLLWSTPRQVWLQQQLGYATPAYAHIPLVYDDAGKKLSKRTMADAINNADPTAALLAAWRHLGQQPPTSALSDASAFWDWAIPRWRIEQVPRDRTTKHD